MERILIHVLLLAAVTPVLWAQLQTATMKLQEFYNFQNRI